MSRIYQGGSAESRYRQTDVGQAYRPQKAASSEKAAREWKQQVIADGDTQLRDLQRKSQAENLESRLTMQVETAGLKTQQLAEQIELQMDQQYEKDVLRKEQTHESLVMKLDAAELQAKNQVQNANMSAMKGAVSSILSFAGSAMQFAQVQGEINAREEAKQQVIDSGAWAFGSDYDVSTPAGASVVDQQNSQSLVEVAEETAVAQSGLNPVDQEAVRASIGVGQSDARVQRQISLGEASFTIGSRLTQAFNDPNRTITIRDTETGQLKSIRPMDAKSYELPQVAMALGQQLTREMGVQNADRYTAVKQYVPQLQNAINNLVAREQSGRLAGEQSSRQSAGFTRAGQVLETGDIGAAWSAYYEAAATSGIYKGDQVKITKAAVEAMVQDATPAQLEQLKNGGYRVFEGGPTFGNDKRFAGLIDEAIRNKNRGLITDFNQNEKFQSIELSNATNSFQEALMNADSPEATQAAHQAYEAKLESLAAAGNGKARLELAEQLSNSNNYNPDNANQLRARIEAGETFPEEFLVSELASGRINSNEYTELKRSGLATPEQKAKVYGGKEARNASNARGKSMVSQTLINNNLFLKNAATDIRNGIVSNISQDINKRRDAAVNSFIQSAGGPDKVNSADVQKFADNWLQTNVPTLLDGVTVDKDTGAVSGYEYMGQTIVTGRLSDNSIPVTKFTSAYIKNPDGSRYSATNYSDLPVQKLEAVAKSGTDINYAGDSILTREEKLAGAKAYVAGQAFPPSVVSKATALGVTPAYLVREQARGIGKELGAMPTQQIPQIKPGMEQVSYVPRSRLEMRALDVIGKYESDNVGSYNAVNQYGGRGGRSTGANLGMYSGDIRKMNQHGGRPLTDFTLGEIMALQAENGMSNSQWRDAGRLHAVGRYQFIGPTFKGVVSRMGLDKNLKFTPEVQDAMALDLLRTGGISQWVGPNDYATPQERATVKEMQRILRNPNATDAQLRRASLTL